MEYGDAINLLCFRVEVKPLGMQDGAEEREQFPKGCMLAIDSKPLDTRGIAFSHNV